MLYYDIGLLDNISSTLSVGIISFAHARGRVEDSHSRSTYVEVWDCMETSSQMQQTNKRKECPLSSIDTHVEMCYGTECFAFLRDLRVCAYVQGAEVGLELIKKALRSSAEILPQNDFQSFYRKHYSRIYKVAYNLLKNIEKTEDITQEVFIKAYLGFDALNADTPLAAWLQKVAINSCLDELRRQKVCVVETRADFDNEEVHKKLLECCPCSPEEHFDNQEMRLLIDTVFRTLPPHYCQALILKCVDGLSYEDIASVMGATIPGVRSIIYRGRRRFMKLYQDFNHETDKLSSN